MSKAILVIDMPSCCDECFVLDDNGDYPMCIITQEQRGYTFRTKDQKMTNCPLKEAPNKLIHHSIDSPFIRAAKTGYNTCIDEILGE